MKKKMELETILKLLNVIVATLQLRSESARKVKIKGDIFIAAVNNQIPLQFFSVVGQPHTKQAKALVWKRFFRQNTQAKHT